MTDEHAVPLRRNRDYVGWFIGETLSALGTAMSSVAYPLLMLYATGSAKNAGVVAAASSIGILATLLVGGALADRWSRRTILVAGPLVQAVAVGSVAVAVIAGHVVVAHVALASFVDGGMVGLVSGASRATLRRLVPAESYSSAVSQMQARDMANRLAGPPLGGALFALARWAPFLGDAISYLAASIGTAMIRRPLGPERAEGHRPPAILVSIAEGAAYLWRSSYLRFLAGWTAVVNGAAGGLLLIIIVLVRDRGGGPALIGLVSAIGAGGGLLGAAMSGRITRRMSGRKVVIALSWVVPLACLGMALSPWIATVAGCYAALMFFVVPLNVILETYEYRVVTDEFVGRVSNTVDFVAMSLRWVGPLAAGATLEAIGARRTMLAWAAFLALVAIATMLARGLRELDRPLESDAPSDTLPA